MADEPTPPIYGPPMSPSIFASKWLSKHRNRLNSHFVKPLRASPTPHPIWIFKLCYDTVEHLIHFYRQAQSLSLSTSDFPDAPERIAPISTNAHLYSPADLPSMQTNPFLGASMLTITVDGFIQRLRVVQAGETLDGLKWEEFPFVWRGMMEEVFGVVEHAERSGWWSVSEEYRTDVAKQFSEKEERDRGLPMDLPSLVDLEHAILATERTVPPLQHTSSPTPPETNPANSTIPPLFPSPLSQKPHSNPASTAAKPPRTNSRCTSLTPLLPIVVLRAAAVAPRRSIGAAEVRSSPGTAGRALGFGARIDRCVRLLPCRRRTSKMDLLHGQIEVFVAGRYQQGTYGPVERLGGFGMLFFHVWTGSAFLYIPEPADALHEQPMSPAIFSSKWLSKFQQLIAQRNIRSKPNLPSLGSHLMYAMCIEGFKHITEFHRDAIKLDLEPLDFATPPPMSKDYKDSNLNNPFFSAADMHSMKYNPFRAAMTVLMLVDTFTARLKAVNYGGKLFGMPWQSFPLEWRQNLNEVFESVDKAREAGWRGVSEKDHDALFVLRHERYTIAAMDREQGITIKPVFGPPMSPTIFQKKWLSKFRTLISEAAGHTKFITFHPLESYDLLSKQYTHLKHFDTQAAALSLQQEDFSEEPTKGIEPILGIANPFTIAIRMLMGVNWYLKKFEEMRGGDRISGFVWHDIPLAVRQRVTDLLLMRARALEDGSWPITEEIREKGAKLLEKKRVY
ncbi:hypothetical protein M409DRAFT_60135 [Zasmidium cellare ATCC 36951]|uniref:Uncharacterized protein n=1 Tax=Zasmidium cellare ATCC 36951 TaxID=1080233 RepID=A0A6A6BZJ2_ZASCE|nr:uncharacterized protein M409DRAFT_60135 [Zasmidium cellare ATCC 36951]KAF2160217.1 hypothetical protein M409DRAFT_60135 [Zasmidium cellare ATCC 36951]